MKNKCLKGIFLLMVITLFIGKIQQKQATPTEFLLANVEALAWPGEFPDYEVNCPTSSTTYGKCRALSMDYSQYPYRAHCVKSSDPNSTCTYSTETEANRYL